MGIETHTIWSDCSFKVEYIWLPFDRLKEGVKTGSSQETVFATTPAGTTE